jgi:hypothetical protein
MLLYQNATHWETYKEQKFPFPQFWKLGSPRSRYWKVWLSGLISTLRIDPPKKEELFLT